MYFIGLPPGVLLWFKITLLLFTILNGITNRQYIDNTFLRQFFIGLAPSQSKNNWNESSFRKKCAIWFIFIRNDVNLYLNFIKTFMSRGSQPFSKGNWNILAYHYFYTVYICLYLVCYSFKTIFGVSPGEFSRTKDWEPSELMNMGKR